MPDCLPSFEPFPFLRLVPHLLFLFTFLMATISFLQARSFAKSENWGNHFYYTRSPWWKRASQLKHLGKSNRFKICKCCNTHSVFISEAKLLLLLNEVLPSGRAGGSLFLLTYSFPRYPVLGHIEAAAPMWLWLLCCLLSSVKQGGELWPSNIASGLISWTFAHL